jgi:hypothetical protein
MLNTTWASLGRWGLVMVGTGALACACGDSNDGDDANPGVGGGGSAQGGEQAHAGKGGEGGKGGNMSEVGGAGSPGTAGVGGVDECGGCEQAHTSIKCSFGEVPLLGDEQAAFDDGTALGCAAVQSRFEWENTGGAAGAAGAAGQAGADAGLCTSYIEPGKVVVRFNGDCHETQNEFKRGECVLGGECCVVVNSYGCSP